MVTRLAIVPRPSAPRRKMRKENASSKVNRKERKTTGRHVSQRWCLYMGLHGICTYASRCKVTHTFVLEESTPAGNLLKRALRVPKSHRVKEG